MQRCGKLPNTIHEANGDKHSTRGARQPNTMDAVKGDIPAPDTAFDLRGFCSVAVFLFLRESSIEDSFGILSVDLCHLTSIFINF